ncbi:hypothetical protein H257_05835 [Aphanomyces astaci]|uniref:Uncharacterized protein n=1 Tax=Aphanomyces astaci TaxID=112090 RepID=W4GPL1_APHAT|nr:hypothetical protein H257_05835 [Aphanomyces astaci]ETV81271.1 hypothetical protein H257_05835 [Aphanomyces astaci]|eukprot:XP_009829129.1 hypothetical protein H257_05835 [Aphanomyces astaci]
MDSATWDSESESSGEDDVVIAIVLCVLVVTAQKKEVSNRDSNKGKRPNIDSKCAQYDLLLRADYFDSVPTYDDSHFRRRFRIRQSLFLQIANDLAHQDPYFHRPQGFSTLQKVAECVRYLATGSSIDDLDDSYI